MARLVTNVVGQVTGHGVEPGPDGGVHRLGRTAPLDIDPAHVASLPAEAIEDGPGVLGSARLQPAG
jgi:hypothetical protein